MHSAPGMVSCWTKALERLPAAKLSPMYHLHMMWKQPMRFSNPYTVCIFFGSVRQPLQPKQLHTSTCSVELISSNQHQIFEVMSHSARNGPATQDSKHPNTWEHFWAEVNVRWKHQSCRRMDTKDIQMKAMGDHRHYICWCEELYNFYWVNGKCDI